MTHRIDTALTLMAPRNERDRLCYLNGALNALDAVRDTVGDRPRQMQDYNDRRREVLEARDAVLNRK